MLLQARRGFAGSGPQARKSYVPADYTGTPTHSLI